MFNPDYSKDHAPICNFVPAYAFYSGVGSALAENLVDLIEWILGFRK